ncbi:MAG TPA: AraC family transcriptional regulator [Mucilaginibacter sp.]|jgi:AraC-like DNA-binding protein
MKKIQILNNQNKIYSEITKNAHYSNECHEFSIRIVFNGSEEYKLGNKTLKIYPENFLVINEGTVFNREIFSEFPVNTISLLYNHQFLNSFHQSMNSSNSILLDEPFPIGENPTPRFLETLYPMKGDMFFNMQHLKNLFDSDNYNDLLMNEYLIHSLINFYRIYDKEVLAKTEQLNVLNYANRKELFRRLNNAKDYMLSNYNQAINLDEISEYACLSPTHFYRTFKQTFNCSPHQYLIQLRLSQAKFLLKNSGYEVREIVNLVGFDSASSFIRLFKEKFGVTPGNYRIGIAA